MNFRPHSPEPPPADRLEGRHGPAVDWAAARWETGTEAPGELAPGSGPHTVQRAFGFIDLSGSTTYLESAGPRAAVDVVTAFRSGIREVCARRGVRVAKWLGDGAFLVAVTPGCIIAACAEAASGGFADPLLVRGGVAVSDALLFDGDDYIGRGVNFAARLCDAAEPGEILGDEDCFAAVPYWVDITERRVVVLKGMGEHRVMVLHAN